METKVCNTCGEEKSILDFELGTNHYKSRVSIYRYNKCKMCDRQRILEKNARSRAKRRKQNREYQKEFEKNNANYIATYRKEYYINNKERIKARVKKYTYNRRATDVSFRLKEAISANVRQAVKKNNRSVFGALPYTVQELKNHLEKQFEFWMTWENYGTYRTEIWDDQNSKTWTWQIDHIVPHSKFNYQSIEDQQFKECWALENLRPYSAKQNVIDGERN